VKRNSKPKKRYCVRLARTFSNGNTRALKISKLPETKPLKPMEVKEND